MSDPLVYAYYVCNNASCTQNGLHKMDTISGIPFGPTLSDVTCGRCGLPTVRWPLAEPVPMSEFIATHPTSP